MKNLLVWLLVIFSCVQGAAQNIQLLDSLRAELRKSKGVDKFKVLNDLGFEYRLSHPDSTIYYCQQAYDLGVSLNLKKDLAKPLSFIGLAKKFNDDYVGAFQAHSQAIEMAKKQSDSSALGFCYNNFGRLFYDQGDISRAYDTFLKSREVFEAINDQSGLAYVFRSLSDLYKSQNDYPKALDMSVQALGIRQSLGEPRAIISSWMELGALHAEMKNKIEAVRCFEKADSIALSLKDKVSDAEIRIRFGEYLISNDEIERAAVMAVDVFNFVEKEKNKRLQPQALQLMGIVAYRQNNLGSAISFFNKVTRMG